MCPETSSAAQVYNIIQSMDINKTSGCDNKDIYIQHTAADVLSPIFSYFFGYSFKFEIFLKF